MGFAAPQPEDRLRENELQIVPLVEAQISEGFRLAVIERWLRVYGDSLRRIAETEVDWWHTEVVLPLLKSGMTPAEMMEAADSRVAQGIAPYLDQTILAMYHGHQEHTWMKSILDRIEATLSEARTFGETRRRVKVIGRLPGEHSCLGLGRARPGLPGWRGFTMTAAVAALQQPAPAVTGGVSGTGGRSPAHR